MRMPLASGALTHICLMLRVGGGLWQAGQLPCLSSKFRMQPSSVHTTNMRVRQRGWVTQIAIKFLPELERSAAVVPARCKHQPLLLGLPCVRPKAAAWSYAGLSVVEFEVLQGHCIMLMDPS